MAAIVVLCGLSWQPGAARAQAPARNSVYVELLGNGVLYSMNYDRKFSDHVSGRVGLMALGAALVPVMGNYLAGNGNHRLELGAGPLLIFAPDELKLDEAEELESTSDFAVAGTATLGYRYQPVYGGFVFRIGFTPVFGEGGVFPWVGASFGYAF
ncbi:MAG TPA: hypothetical protein VK399_09745 [Longimicrobiaceae bacterium]|nr:hypothetical protein [Longimicrobiaceae bacterium]